MGGTLTGVGVSAGGVGGTLRGVSVVTGGVGGTLSGVAVSTGGGGGTLRGVDVVGDGDGNGNGVLLGVPEVGQGTLLAFGCPVVLLLGLLPRLLRLPSTTPSRSASAAVLHDTPTTETSNTRHISIFIFK